MTLWAMTSSTFPSTPAISAANGSALSRANPPPHCTAPRPSEQRVRVGSSALVRMPSATDLPAYEHCEIPHDEPRHENGQNGGARVDSRGPRTPGRGAFEILRVGLGPVVGRVRDQGRSILHRRAPYHRLDSFSPSGCGRCGLFADSSDVRASVFPGDHSVVWCLEQPS